MRYVFINWKIIFEKKFNFSSLDFFICLDFIKSENARDKWILFWTDKIDQQHQLIG